MYLPSDFTQAILLIQILKHPLFLRKKQTTLHFLQGAASKRFYTSSVVNVIFFPGL